MRWSSDVAAFGCPVVEITGGEPLLQPDVYPLMQRAASSAGHTVLLETGGHRSVAQVPAGVIRIIDVKCPGQRRVGEERLGEPRSPDAGGRGQVRDPGSRRLRVRADVVARHALAGRCAAVLFSPVHGVLAGRDLAAWVLADRLPVRLQLQVHKYIWERGCPRGLSRPGAGGETARSVERSCCSAADSTRTPPARWPRRTATSCTP